MMYFSTGNASPWAGSLQPGDNLFIASIVALDYKTGAYRWHFQPVRHELWDYDMPNPHDPRLGASATPKASPVQPVPVGDSYINQCPDPLYVHVGLGYSGALAPRRNELQPNLLSPADRLRRRQWVRAAFGLRGEPLGAA